MDNNIVRMFITLNNNTTLDCIDRLFLNCNNIDNINKKIVTIIKKIDNKLYLDNNNKFKNYLITIYLNNKKKVNQNIDNINTINNICIKNISDKIISNYKINIQYNKDLQIYNRFMIYPKNINKNNELGDISRKVFI